MFSVNLIFLGAVNDISNQEEHLKMQQWRKNEFGCRKDAVY